MSRCDLCGRQVTEAEVVAAEEAADAAHGECQRLERLVAAGVVAGGGAPTTWEQVLAAAEAVVAPGGAAAGLAVAHPTVYGLHSLAAKAAPRKIADTDNVLTDLPRLLSSPIGTPARVPKVGGGVSKFMRILVGQAARAASKAAATAVGSDRCF